MAQSTEVGRLVGQNIRHHRKLADLSQEELAFRASLAGEPGSVADI
jgi:hypothetical protein